MRKLLVTFFVALLTLSVMGVAPHDWSLARAGEEVCVGPRQLLEFYRAPPTAIPDTEMLAVLEGSEARAFVIQTGGVRLAEFASTVFILHAPKSYPERIVAVVADAAGCIIRLSGKRTDTPTKRAEGSFDRAFVERFLERLRANSPPSV